jgi:hypothetical protein
MSDTYKLVREIPVEREYDLFVAGGGPAGCAAAICAARLGADVLLAEQTGCLGGMATSGLVTAFDGMADGEKPLVGGFMREVVETLYERGWLPSHVEPEHWRRRLLMPTRFHPEPLKLLLDELAEDAGVEVRFFTRAIGAEADPDKGQVAGVLLHQVAGLRYVPAGAFIDATGDAWLAHHCGADYRQAGRDTENIMAASLCWLGVGMDLSRTVKPDDYVAAARAEGDFPYREFRSVLSRISPCTIGFNAGHLYGLDACDQQSLSTGMREGRRIAHRYNEFYRKHVPGYEEMQVAATAPLMGVRESRRIVGEYELTFDDMRSWRHFPDQVGVFNKEVDIHAYSDDPEELERVRRQREERVGWPEKGDSYGIPYGVMVPKGWRNLWVAGRCASCDRTVHGSLRVMPAAAMMGQAAGTAAVQSLRTGQSAGDLDTGQLVRTLRESGAHLPQEELSKEMTRA